MTAQGQHLQVLTLFLCLHRLRPQPFRCDGAERFRALTLIDKTPSGSPPVRDNGPYWCRLEKTGMNDSRRHARTTPLRGRRFVAVVAALAMAAGMGLPSSAYAMDTQEAEQAAPMQSQQGAQSETPDESPQSLPERDGAASSAEPAAASDEGEDPALTATTSDNKAKLYISTNKIGNFPDPPAGITVTFTAVVETGTTYKVTIPKSTKNNGINGT